LSLTPRQFRYAFGNAVSPAESDELYQRWSIPSPGKPIFELASASLSRRSPAKVNTTNSTRGPLLLIAGGKDHGAPAAVAKATVKLYRSSPAVTDYQEYPDRGHSLPIDSGWREVAEATLAWLKQHSR
jgi:pimeloyl-ACP methyl ester carboxylesterase